jgi:hypothetical protein
MSIDCRTLVSTAVRRAVLASIGIGLAVAVLLHAQIRHLDRVPDLGDPLFSTWRVGWVNHQLLSDPRHLFDANIFYPEPLTLTFSDPVILPALTAGPLLAIGVHPVVAYNLLLISGFWLSGIAVYLLVDRLTGSSRAAFIAGLIYACYSYRFDHYSHLELQMTQWMPVALLALHSFMTTGTWRAVIAFTLATVAQLYSSMYYAAFFVLYAVIITLALLLVHRPPLQRLVPLAIGGALAALLALPLERAFTAAQPSKGERDLDEIALYSAVPSDYLRANPYSVVWRHRLRPPMQERSLFPGAGPAALAALAIAPPTGALPIVYAAGLVLSFDGSLGLNGVSYPHLRQWLSVFRNLRSPARFGALVGLTLSILAGFGAQRALTWRRSATYQALVFVGLVAFVMTDAWPELTLRPVWPDPPRVYAATKYLPRVVLAELPMPKDETLNTAYMYFSVWHWRPMVNGYSGYVPASYTQLRSDIARFPSDEAIDALRRRGVTHVTINCGLGYPGCDELLDAMQRAPRLRLLANTRWIGAPVQLYELLAPQ